MYILLLIAWLGAGGLLAARGFTRKSRNQAALGIAALAAGVCFFLGLNFWGEMLWFDSIGYGDRFWTVVWTQAGAFLGGALAAGLVAAALGFFIAPGRYRLSSWPRWVAALGGGLIAAGGWETILLYWNAPATEGADPIHGLSIGFYLFSLPFYDLLQSLAIWISVVAVASALVASLTVARGEKIRLRDASQASRTRLHPLLPAAAFLALTLALGKVLDVYHLLYSQWGVVAGPGWTDAHIRLPAFWIVAALTALLGLLPLAGRNLLRQPSDDRGRPPRLGTLVAAWVGIGAIWLVGLGAVPALIQWLVVEPNEITFEKPYIAHNIEYTRRAFDLDAIEERQFPARERFSREDARENRDILDEVRLWDWRALDAVYKQFQEIRLYYEFHDVDIDRYHLERRYRQVMVSPREMELANLPEQSQTFVNRRFKYTHGYGLTLATVSDFTPEGLPNLLIKDIPPVSSVPGVEVEKPQIYYGELTRSPAVVNTTEEEFDHPSGDQNVYIRYPGKGGVKLENLWRKFVFGWMFDGTRFFLSTYPTAESRFMFRRQIRERAQALAPFLKYDDDPYIVLADGRLYWMLDGYTSSQYYPYSEPYSSREVIEYREGDKRRELVSDTVGYLDGRNYVRNSVKVVIDAFDGSVDLYVFEPEDPIIRTWRRIFPALFKQRDEMPDALEAHIRYPADLLLAQGLVYAKYHMGDPEVFYNQEDLWIRATEKYYNRVQPVEPYYVMWRLPESGRAEFVLMLPFTPKNRQVLIGWIAGLCDPGNYGRFLAYKFPKERRVLGPQQVETKVDQDRFLSGQLTLWDQRGSNVIRGNVLAIPIDETLLYVEPIYLQAETAAYPELRLVVVMHGDTISYAETFDEALEGIFQGGRRDIPAQARPEGSVSELARAANQAFESYLENLSQQNFEEAAQQLKRLRDLLQRMAGE